MPTLKDTIKGRILRLSRHPSHITRIRDKLCVPTCSELFLTKELKRKRDVLSAEPVAGIIPVAVDQNDFLAAGKQVFDVKFVSSDSIGGGCEGAGWVVEHGVGEGGEVEGHTESGLSPSAVEEGGNVRVREGFGHVVGDVKHAAGVRCCVSQVWDYCAALDEAEAGPKCDEADFVDIVVIADELGVRVRRAFSALSDLRRTPAFCGVIGFSPVVDRFIDALQAVSIVEQVLRIVRLLIQRVDTTIRQAEGIDVENSVGLRISRTSFKLLILVLEISKC